MNTHGIFAGRQGGFDGLRGWGWALALGIALVVLGMIALVATQIFTLGSVVALGVIMIVAGVVQVVHAFKAHEWQGVLLHLATGLLYFVVGLMMTSYPLMGAMALTLMFAIFFVVTGSFRIIGAIMTRQGKWGWSVLSGAVSLALGIMIWSQWPASSLWLIGTLLGVDLIFNGAAWLAIAFGVRKFPLRRDGVTVARGWNEAAGAASCARRPTPQSPATTPGGLGRSPRT